ncbi:hypothetical protein FACUT_13221 [Fusarium acutatum]|uniref:Uncharacterized protein n=1 Tax=Fusarium acutatum TaxID=78861 RepID=A0A8H4JDQ8_9HYPO|nr:hypothetical protein FACUT_13221 [Fusarium acutatum]
MPSSSVPLDGPFDHEEIPRRDIASLKVKLAKAKYLAADLNQNGRAGSDDAAEAGYNSENRSEALMLTKECQAVVDVARSLQAETNETIAAIKEIERVKATQPPISVSPDLRREASAQILELLTGSRDGLNTLIQQVLSGASPEIRDAVTESLSRATDSQTVRWIHGAQQMPQVAALQQTIRERDTELSALKEDIQIRRNVAFGLQRDRHQAETNLRAERAKVDTSEKQLSRAKAELNRAKEKIGTLEEDLRITKLSRDAYQNQVAWQNMASEQQISEKNEEIGGLIRQVQDLDEANMDLEAEKETLACQLLERDQSIVTLRQQIASDAQHAQAEQALIETELGTSNSKLKGAQKEAKDTTQRLHQAEGRLLDLEAKLAAVQKYLDSARQEIDKAEGVRSTLEDTISSQRESLRRQTGEIGRLNSLLTARDEKVDSQVEQASIFLRRMSLNVESGVWRSVAEGILTDSTVALAAQIPWKPWRVLPSWSHDEALHVREDDRSTHAVAVDIIAIMRVPTAPVEPLLSRLQSLQEMLMNTSPLVSTISQQILESLTGAVGDERLHLMHNVLICQIVDLLNGGAVEPTEVILDPKATALVSALKSWDSESGAGLNLTCSVSYPDFALVGFNRNPAGIVAASPSNRELRWIDKAQINDMLMHIELSSEMGDPTPIPLPLDTRERQMWSVAHFNDHIGEMIRGGDTGLSDQEPENPYMSLKVLKFSALKFLFLQASQQNITSQQIPQVFHHAFQDLDSAVKNLKLSKNSTWPWNVSLHENDLSQGASTAFKEWRQSQGPSVETQESSRNPQLQASPRSQHQGPVPQTRAEAEQMILETIQRANELDREVFHLRRIARQWSPEDEASPQGHRPRDFSGTKPLEGRAIKRKLTGGEEQDAENLSNENKSMSVSSPSQRARLDNTAAVDTYLKVEHSQDEPLVHPSMAPPHHQNDLNNRDHRNHGSNRTAQAQMDSNVPKATQHMTPIGAYIEKVLGFVWVAKFWRCVCHRTTSAFNDISPLKYSLERPKTLLMLISPDLAILPITNKIFEEIHVVVGYSKTTQAWDHGLHQMVCRDYPLSMEDRRRQLWWAYQGNEKSVFMHIKDGLSPHAYIEEGYAAIRFIEAHQLGGFIATVTGLAWFPRNRDAIIRTFANNPFVVREITDRLITQRVIKSKGSALAENEAELFIEVLPLLKYDYRLALLVATEASPRANRVKTQLSTMLTTKPEHIVMLERSPRLPDYVFKECRGFGGSLAGQGSLWLFLGLLKNRKQHIEEHGKYMSQYDNLDGFVHDDDLLSLLIENEEMTPDDQRELHGDLFRAYMYQATVCHEQLVGDESHSGPPTICTLFDGSRCVLGPPGMSPTNLVDILGLIRKSGDKVVIGISHCLERDPNSNSLTLRDWPLIPKDVVYQWEETVGPAEVL